MSLTDTFTSTPTSALKSLLETVRNGQEGFRNASENVKDADLKALFSRFSLQRAKFAGELEAELHTLGEEDPHKETGTVAGAIHRGWINLKTAVTGHDRHAILAEAERGEDEAKKAYRETLERTDLPANVREIVSDQAVQVQAAHDEVRSLRDAAKNS